jgi:hypothetical protein
MSVKSNFIAGYLTLLSGVISSWIMYSSGGYKAENAHVPLIIGLIGFLFILGAPVVLRALIKRVRESELFFNFIIVYLVSFGIFQFYFDVGFVNSNIISLILSLSILDKNQKEGDIYADIEYSYLPCNMHHPDHSKLSSLSIDM